jgi:tetratricopeptide (TPR) repeat protein
MSHTMESACPTHEAIRAQVQLMVTSATFTGARRAIRLLSWVVNETLAGRAAGIKDFTVGADGLGRGAGFDPRKDATARVEAHRLRTRIDLYYAKEGAADPVRIMLPKGSYVPVFSAGVATGAAVPATERRRSGNWRSAVVAGMVAIIIGAVLYAWWPSTAPRARHYTEDEEAQRLYSQGVYFLRKPTRQGIDNAIDYLSKAIAKDPGFALARVKLANCYILKSVETGPDPLMRQARDLVDRAIGIDNTLAEAYALRGFIAWIYDLDAAAAERALQTAFDLDPESAEVHYVWARVQADTGHFDAALSHARETTRGSPLSPYNRKRVPYVLYLAGRNDEAIAGYLDLIELEPDFIQTQRELGLAYQQKSMFDEALAQFRRVETLPGLYAPTMARADIAQLLAVSGNASEAQRILDELLLQEKSAYVSSYDIAVIYTALGKPDEAFAWLDRAVEQRPFWLSLIKVDPRLGILRADPRFTLLLRRLRL